VLDELSVSDPKSGAFLAHAEVLETSAERIRLRYERASVASMALEDRPTQAKILEIASKLFGATPELVIVAKELEGSVVPSTPRASVVAASVVAAGISSATISSAAASVNGPRNLEAAADSDVAVPISVFAVDREQRERAEQAALAEARNHPVVLEAVRVLGARLKHIELPKS
jgi:hypothetical protein